MNEEHRRVSTSEATPSWLQEIRNYWAELAQVQTEAAPQDGSQHGASGHSGERTSA